MSAAEMARHSYDAARNEILTRMQLRDRALLTYLAIVGALLGVALVKSDNEGILFVVPYIAFASAILVSQHDVMMIQLGEFCCHELGPFLIRCSPPDQSEYAPH
jgi:hypothetical protein